MKLTNMRATLVIIISLFSIQILEANTVKDTFARYPNAYFIESGSYAGDGIQMALEAGFENIYSIELEPFYFQFCCDRFESNPFVKLIQGDSSEILFKILSEINVPVTFWLDGHYSGLGTAKGKTNTPLLMELDQISKHHIKNHTILVDDLRQLGTEDMDFVTLEEVMQKIRSINPNYTFLFEDGHIPKDVLVAVVKDM